MRRALGPLAVVGTFALMLACILPAGRVPVGDAPLLLATASALLGEPARLLELVTPHPPLGYLLAAFGPWPAALLALGLCWWGMQRLLGREPWVAWALLVASPLTWAAVENLHWDLLLAGFVTAALGALAKDKPWQAGGFIAAACLTKFNAPLFLALPALVWLLRKRDPRILVAALPLLWLGWHHAEIGAYLSGSLDQGARDTASDAPSGLAVFHPEHLAYYPAVLRSALGWPGLLLALLGFGALRKARPAWLAALSGLLLLSCIGRREARYLLPVLPALLVAAEAMLPPRKGLFAGLVALPPLAMSAWTFATLAEPKALPRLELELLAWDWPSVAEPFEPVSAPLELYEVDAVLERLPQGQSVGLMLVGSPEAPVAAHLLYRSQQLGLDHRFVELGRPTHEGYVSAQALPWGSEDFETVYVLQVAGDRRVTDWIRRSELEIGWSHQLPRGQVGRLLEP